MCGLAGIFRYDGQQADRQGLVRMLHALAPRGPDEQRLRVRGSVGLAHARLAVLDPATGRQPMERAAFGAYGPAAVVFNGQIYNHRELRRQLQEMGHIFHTDHSDTEVLLHGHRQWGPELPSKLRGMFAYAIHDEAAGCVVMARDRAGKKPLFIRRGAGCYFFGSTLSSLVAGDVSDPSVDRRALRDYLTFGYTCGRTLLEGVMELPPGGWARLASDGTLSMGRYWRMPDPPETADPPRPRPTEDDWKRLLLDAVRCRLEADVPLGCFLSGGIDSSLVAAIACHVTGGGIKTFTARMPDADYDEGPWAARVAGHIGAEHRELMIEPAVLADLKRLIATMGEPLGDSSILPTYWLSRAARRHVTVALSGDGGDELFGGYRRYRAMNLLMRQGWWLKRLPGLGDGQSGRAEKSMLKRLERLAAAARWGNPADQYLQIVRLFSDEQIALLDGEPAGASASIMSLAEWAWPAEPIGPDEAGRRWDFEHYLPGDLLRKVDRASMATGLEVRCPLLDTALMETAIGGGLRAGDPHGVGKGVLRKLAGEMLPPEVARRGKSGFAVPLASWLGGPLREPMRQMLLEDPALGELGLNRDAAARFIIEHEQGTKDHAHRLFALMSLSLWRQWMRQGAQPVEQASPVE